MADYKAPLRDMRFVLNEVFEVSRLWAQLPGLAEAVDEETALAVLEEAGKVTSQRIAPLSRSADEEGCHWDNGAVRTPAGFIDAYRTYADGGWVGVGGDPAYGGMGMPKVISAQVEEMVNSSSLAFGLYPMLTAGACLSINAHASEELKTRYLPNMYAGVWAGSMCLTEPHAGTDLGIIRTRAEPQADGSYKVTGTKIFITGGEHDLTENIIHLVLAKLPDAPAGPKGISLFLVPKFRVNADGSLGARNPYRQRMADDPEHHARNPQLQAQAHGGGQRAVGNGHGARCTAQQDQFGERAMQGHLEAGREGIRAAHTTAPPEKLKNDRKKLDAANAMDRPNTIWISLRKPPLVSPKASARPVAMMMMMTATIRATGPWIDSKMDCSGASQGMLEPAA